MTGFRYEAVDASGRRRRGTVQAENARRARKDILARGLTPLSLKSVADRAGTTGAKKRRKASSAEVIAATRQLATLIDAATPVEEALNAVASQMKGGAMPAILLSVRARIIEGWRMSDAMAEYDSTFSPLYRGIVAAGETSGNLGPVMLRLADMIEKNRTMATKALSALVYPAAIFVIAILVIAGLMNFVVPKIVSQFSNTGDVLPLLTRIVIGASEFLQAYGLALLAMVALIGLGIWRARREQKIRRQMDRAMLRLPVVGGLLRDLDAARFSRTLATLFASGAPLLDALKAARRTVTNAHIADRLELTMTGVREGASLSAGVRRAEVFPPMMASMISAGERSGALPAMLEKTADQMEAGFDAAVTVGLRLLEPLVIVILGGFVLVIVLAIMMPILQTNSMAL